MVEIIVTGVLLGIGLFAFSMVIGYLTYLITEILSKIL